MVDMMKDLMKADFLAMGVTKERTTPATSRRTTTPSIGGMAKKRTPSETSSPTTDKSSIARILNEQSWAAHHKFSAEMALKLNQEKKDRVRLVQERMAQLKELEGGLEAELKELIYLNTILDEFKEQAIGGVENV